MNVAARRETVPNRTGVSCILKPRNGYLEPGVFELRVLVKKGACGL